MTTPSKAAIERAREIWGNGGSNNVIPAIAEFIDTVDRVARVCVKNAEAVGDLPDTVHMLRTLMLPDEPDPLKDIVADAVRACRSGDKLHEAIRAALTAAGLKIVKDQA